MIEPEVSPHISLRRSFFKNGAPKPIDFDLELITEHHVRSRRCDLMINVKPAGDPFSPVVGPALVHNKINRIGLPPFVQDSLFVQEDVARGYSNWCFLTGILINKKEFAVQIENQAAAVVEWPFEHCLAACLQTRI